MHINLKEKNIEFQELKAENVHFCEKNEKTLQDLNRIQKEIYIVREEIQSVCEENNRNSSYLSDMQEEKKKIMNDINELSKEIDGFEDNNYQLERKLRVIEEQDAELDKIQKDLLGKIEKVY